MAGRRAARARSSPNGGSPPCSDDRTPSSPWELPVVGGEKQNMSIDHWDEVSFVIRSQYRTTVLEQLASGPATPSQIAACSGFSLSHISRALQELRRRDLVELLVSEQQKTGRLYGMTERADRVWETVESESLN